MYMISCIGKFMAEEKASILLENVSIEGDLVEKDKIIVDAKISGDIKAEEIETHAKSNIKGNISSMEKCAPLVLENYHSYVKPQTKKINIGGP